MSALFRPGLLPMFNIKRMATVLGFLGLFNLGLDALPSPKENRKRVVEDKINSAAVTVADAIREVELKLKESANSPATR